MPPCGTNGAPVAVKMVTVDKGSNHNAWRARAVRMLKQLHRVEKWLSGPPSNPGPPETDIYCRTSPRPENAVNLFSGQWSSRLPAPFLDLTGGGAALFEDGRIAWGVQSFGGVEGMRVLELGPLEGGHTFMLDRLGVSEIIAVEANTRAFLRCLVVKELLEIDHARYLCGDFNAYLNDAVAEGKSWDLCLAIGVLYHQQDPVALS